MAKITTEVLSLFLIVFTVVATGYGAPRIVAPQAVLHDELFTVKVTGLLPGTVNTLRAEYYSRAGTIWRSETRFQADVNGIVDLSVSKPVEALFSLPDPLAMFWSMVNTKERTADASLFDSDDQSVVRLQVMDGDKAIASHTVILRYRQIGVSTVEIRNEAGIGTLFSPPTNKKAPGVIVLGGSEGGIPRQTAALIASHGYVTLALAYFGSESGPNELEKIPVETVDRAVEWLRKQPGVDTDQLVLMGSSKGAELALIAASRNPKIRGVIVSAPSSVVFEGIGSSKISVSSWTIEGKDVPFAPYVRNELYTQSRRLVDLYNPTLAGAGDNSKIPVEKISGPILLISGKEDMLWPSARMAGDISARLSARGFKYPVKNISLENAGHHAGSFPLRPAADSVRLGGTAQGIAQAQVEAWREIVKFLASITN
jgi:dienelactone hydrolase